MDINTITQKINYKTERIKKLQAEIKELEAKRTQLENEEIVKSIHEAEYPNQRVDRHFESVKRKE